MFFPHSHRGAMLVDVMVTLMLMSIAALVFSAAFPAGFKASAQAHGYKLAAAIAQRKMEQVRAMKYESLTQPLLVSAGIIDTDSYCSPYSFTAVDKVDAKTQTDPKLHAGLPAGTGTLVIRDTAPDTKQVTITVSWQDSSTNTLRSVQLVTLFVDKRARKVN